MILHEETGDRNDDNSLSVFTVLHGFLSEKNASYHFSLTHITVVLICA